MKSFKLKAKLTLAGLFAAAALIVMPAVVFAGYAPSNRPTFQCITPTNCPGAEYVVFNSFTNAPNYGDERAFLDAKSATITGPGGYQDSLTVQDDGKYVVRAYVHNNANPNAIGVSAATAINAKLQVLLPTGKDKDHVIGANLSADNANPRNVSDTVDFVGARPFTVEFDKSAPVKVTYRPNGTGDFVTRTLPGASFSNDSTLNASLGNMKGCFEFAALVTMTVTVDMEKPEIPPEVPPETPPEQPEKPRPEKPEALPVTGPAAVFTTFLGVSSVSALLHRIFTRRQS